MRQSDVPSEGDGGKAKDSRRDSGLHPARQLGLKKVKKSQLKSSQQQQDQTADYAKHNDKHARLQGEHRALTTPRRAQRRTAHLLERARRFYSSQTDATEPVSSGFRRKLLVNKTGFAMLAPCIEALTSSFSQRLLKSPGAHPSPRPPPLKQPKNTSK
jgi:hypothetical protein